jgi:hypothetical protein
MALRTMLHHAQSYASPPPTPAVSLPPFLLQLQNVQRWNSKGFHSYVIDDSLSTSFQEYLSRAADKIPRLQDVSGFPGEKIPFTMAPLDEKRFLQRLVLIDPQFEPYSTVESVFIGIIRRGTVENKSIPPNPHTDSATNSTVALMSYLNTVGGGTALFGHKLGETAEETRQYPESHEFSFETKDIPDNLYWRMTERFDAKKNRTIIFDSTRLHSGFFDLAAWPESEVERRTFNVFLSKNSKE